jgi:hypothetical protein
LGREKDYTYPTEIIWTAASPKYIDPEKEEQEWLESLMT